MTRKATRIWLIGALAATALTGGGLIFAAAAQASTTEPSTSTKVTAVDGAKLPKPSEVEYSTPDPLGEVDPDALYGKATSPSTTVSAVPGAKLPDSSTVRFSTPTVIGKVHGPARDGNTTSATTE